MSTRLQQWLNAQPHGAIMRLQSATGIPYRSLHRYITGERTPPLVAAVAISKVTGVPPEDLVAPDMAATAEHPAPPVNTEAAE